MPSRTIRTWRRLWNMDENKHSPQPAESATRPPTSTCGRSASSASLWYRDASSPRPAVRAVQVLPGARRDRHYAHDHTAHQAVPAAPVCNRLRCSISGPSAPRKTRCCTATAGWISPRAWCEFRSTQAIDILAKRGLPSRPHPAPRRSLPKDGLARTAMKTASPPSAEVSGCSAVPVWRSLRSACVLLSACAFAQPGQLLGPAAQSAPCRTPT